MQLSMRAGRFQVNDVYSRGQQTVPNNRGLSAAGRYDLTGNVSGVCPEFGETA